MWNSAKIMMCGGVSGAVAKTCTAPLARLTILYQAFRGVIAREGVLSLWKGNLVTIIHRVPYSATNFGLYEVLNTQLHPVMENDVARRMTAGGLAGAGACAMAYPLDLLRSRMAAETLSVSAYTGVRSSLQKIVQEDGLRGLYKGLGATLIQVVPNLALNFTFYDGLKHWATEPGQAPSTAASLGCGCFAGFLTSTLTYPLDVVRRRMQVHKRGTLYGSYSYMQTLNHVMKYGGVRALYSGIIPEYCKVLPGMAIAFATYETLKHWTGAASFNSRASSGGGGGSSSGGITEEEGVGAPLVEASQL
ncbi:MAG: hypothetical protein WDW38_010833 [Sanguina aurantia]